MHHTAIEFIAVVKEHHADLLRDNTILREHLFVFLSPSTLLVTEVVVVVVAVSVQGRQHLQRWGSS